MSEPGTRPIAGDFAHQSSQPLGPQTAQSRQQTSQTEAVSEIEAPADPRAPDPAVTPAELEDAVRRLETWNLDGQRAQVSFEPAEDRLLPLQATDAALARREQVEAVIREAELSNTVSPAEVAAATEYLFRNGGAAEEALARTLTSRLGPEPEQPITGVAEPSPVSQPGDTGTGAGRSLAGGSASSELTREYFSDIGGGTADRIHAQQMSDLRAVAEVDDFELDIGAGRRKLSEVLDDLEADEQTLEVVERCLIPRAD